METATLAVSSGSRAGDAGEVTVSIPLQVTFRVGAPPVPGQAPQGEGALATLASVPAGLLRDGDVLPYRGSGWISLAIRFFDGTDVSHAGCMADRGR